MAFRIPFHEHLVIEADTAADVRALIAEFGVTIGLKQLPPAATPAPPVVEAAAVGRRNGRREAAPAKRTLRAAVAPEPATDVGELGARILTTLQGGAFGTADLAKRARGSVWDTRKLLRQLEAQRIVHSTGATISLRWHLGAKGSSPKEAESRGRG